MSKEKTLLSWNVNGIRAAERKGFLNWIDKGLYDIVCVQETKVNDTSLLSDAVLQTNGYHAYWNCATEKKGYSGVAVYTKEEPLVVKTDFGKNLLSKEGRMLECDFDDYILLNIYFPNGGMSPERLAYKLEFYKQFLRYVQSLRKKCKHVIFCGDLNTAHGAIDLARPKENVEHSGFMPIEREWLDRFVEAGFVDTFRLFHQEGGQYSYWDMKTRARDRNVGWRIDYFWVDDLTKKLVIDAFILSEVMGSDHCPVGIRIKSI
ncbi:MAG: exodeoxyribonuclease III [Parcubacteria group bacterium CG08_land_8_20_14_0_20_48_21]|nr:MAG: exodeoxyribonuclease III [Parcubacteria group bacterium CG2_30_48_51]PIS32893.1 MAG: exodeoxyribonuclease III [Parcubacteria group bacterium CG08_land_8_20_14_0_20_48_21]PIW78769.1 MAG: exodeoxyribonuclease III [Parcubacteria group bacterium CG_4_8_14_3_um_filter_48_16]PIY78262.1 MAG: exodeoxyribonuclease III [Parcubacteria group bacterium CG_4_10_14_0_8_um_filter_48_154]PIZ77613.1 MAG: exodeoxyribonuclease III [bacterium CG_4_10_14_0_2_um_filter_48_144]PJC39717.1 MAG: exodeoxyribonucl